MTRQRLLLIMLTGLLAAAPASAQGMLDLFPQEAAGAIAIRDLDDLAKKGDLFVEEAKIKYSLPPSQLIPLVNKLLGINEGLNRRGSAAVLILRPELDNDWPLVPVIPFANADAMAKNFGLQKGQLEFGAIRVTNRDAGGPLRFAVRMQDHVFLAKTERALERIVKSKPVSASFSPAQRKQLNDSDLLIHFGRFLWEKPEQGIVREIVARIKPGDDPQEADFAKQLVKGLQDVQNAGLGVRVGGGLGFNFIANVPKDSHASKLFRTLRGTRPPSTLTGLPEGDVLLAQAYSTDDKQAGLLAKGLFNVLLEDLLVANKFIAPVDRLNYLDVLHEVSRKLDGNRLALYQNDDERKLGLFSVIAILDTRDAPQFLREMKTLMKMADAASLDFTRKDVKDEIDLERLVRDLGSSVYATRLAASTKLVLIGEPALPYLDKAVKADKLDLEAARRIQHLHARITNVAAERRKALLSSNDFPLFLRPALTFVPGVEKRAGVNIDAVHIRLAGLEKVENHQYRQLLGPDWDKIRLAVVGKQVVVLLGSDVPLFEAAIKNLQTARPGLANSKRLAAFQKQPTTDRLFEFHVSTEAMLRLITPKAPRGGAEVSLTSLALSLSAETLQLDAWMPMAEVRAIAKKGQEGMP